ncbi:MAG: hypothetical protein VB934_16630 [Polyangiaceae bacterium]
MDARLICFGLFLATSAITTLGGCGKQTEGERCELAAGLEGEDSDCDEGLICVQKNFTICCPKEGATHPACTGDSGSTSSSATTSGSGGSGGSGSGGSGSGGSGSGGSGSGGSASGGSGGN